MSRELVYENHEKEVYTVTFDDIRYNRHTLYELRIKEWLAAKRLTLAPVDKADQVSFTMFAEVFSTMLTAEGLPFDPLRVRSDPEECWKAYEAWQNLEEAFTESCLVTQLAALEKKEEPKTPPISTSSKRKR